MTSRQPSQYNRKIHDDDDKEGDAVNDDTVRQRERGRELWFNSRPPYQKCIRYEPCAQCSTSDQR